MHVVTCIYIFLALKDKNALVICFLFSFCHLKELVQFPNVSSFPHLYHAAKNYMTKFAPSVVYDPLNLLGYCVRCFSLPLSKILLVSYMSSYHIILFIKVKGTLYDKAD